MPRILSSHTAEPTSHSLLLEHDLLVRRYTKRQGQSLMLLLRQSANGVHKIQGLHLVVESSGCCVARQIFNSAATFLTLLLGLMLSINRRLSVIHACACRERRHEN